MTSTVVRDEISQHEVKIFRALRSSRDWMSNHEICAALVGVAPRTVREHTRRLVERGILEMRPTFPGFRFRFSEDGAAAARDYVRRLDDAAVALGIT